MTPADASSPDDEGFFPWRRELDQIREDLERKEPVSIGIAGRTSVEPSLAGKAAEIARQTGWLVLPGDPGDAIKVDKRTTPESFCEAVGTHLESKVPASTLQQGELARRSVEVPALLRQAAPVFLVVNALDPAAEFLAWFFTPFMAGMMAARAPVAVVVSGDRLDKGPFQKDAARFYTLTRLEPGRARKLVEAATTRVKPPLEPSELERYVDAVSKQPDLLDSLLRALQLAESAGLRG